MAKLDISINGELKEQIELDEAVDIKQLLIALKGLALFANQHKGNKKSMMKGLAHGWKH